MRFELRFLSTLSLCTALLLCGFQGRTSSAATAAGQAPISASTSQVDTARIARADEEPGNWFTVGRTFSEQHFSPLTQIDEDNVAELGFAWDYDTRSTRGLEASPVVIDGTLYTSGNWGRVYALNAATGEEIWTYDPEVPGSWARKACCDVVNRGVAVWKGLAFVGSLDGRLIALDAATGEPAWEQDTLIDRRRAYTITGAPRIIGDRVIIGNGGADYGVRGYVTAYDAATGRQAWRFFTVPGPPSEPFEHPELAMAAETWDPQSRWEFAGGGTAWDGMAYDPELDLLYVGTGNGAPYPLSTRSPAGGDNLFLASILAIDPDTGQLVWHYQTTPGENWDYTAVQPLLLADLQIDGRLRKVILQAPKNGFFYVLDRETGELLSAEPYVTVDWASHVDMATGRPVPVPAGDYDREAKIISPSWWGGHNWQPMAFSPLTGLVYIPTMEIAMTFERVQEDYAEGQQNFGVLTRDDSSLTYNPARPHALKAWDPVAQREVWRIDYRFAYNGGLLATAGNLVFQGTVDGRFKAYTADTGKRLADIEVGTSIMAAPVTYTVNGTQFIAVMAGYGGGGLGRFPEGSAAREYGNAGRIVAFKLGGGAVPIPPRVDWSADVPLPPRREVSEETFEEGRRHFYDACSECHQLSDQPSGYPNLLRMEPATHDLFNRIVLEGFFDSEGMPGFGARFTAVEVDAIHAFLIETAYELREDESG